MKFMLAATRPDVRECTTYVTYGSVSRDAAVSTLVVSDTTNCHMPVNQL